MNHTFQCLPEWEGKFCEVPKLCQGMPFGHVGEGIIGCCPSLAIDTTQNCCKSATAKLDKDGTCCESGNVDACGICEGTSLFLDSINQCCSTIRDEKGVCCASGNLDECHTCDGDGISCATNFTVSVALDSKFEVSENASSAWMEILSPLMAAFGNALGVTTDALILDGVELTSSLVGDCYGDPDPQHGCLHSGLPQVRGILNVTVLPIPLTSLSTMKILTTDVQTAISSISTIAVPSSGTTIQAVPSKLNIASVTKIRRAGICGNGICERGERCTSRATSATTGDPLCCLRDCPFVPMSCPIPLHGPKAKIMCTGHGVCLDSTGQCDCFKGYTGIDCANCTLGWVAKLDGTCTKIAEPEEMVKLSQMFYAQGLQNISSFDSEGNQIRVKKSVAAVVATVVVTILLALTLVLIYVVIKQRNNESSIEMVETGDATTGTDDLEEQLRRMRNWRSSIFGSRRLSKRQQEGASGWPIVGQQWRKSVMPDGVEYEGLIQQDEQRSCSSSSPSTSTSTSTNPHL